LASEESGALLVEDRVRGAPLERVQLILPRSAQTRSKPFR